VGAEAPLFAGCGSDADGDLLVDTESRFLTGFAGSE
jgi:hypothetical protein